MASVVLGPRQQSSLQALTLLQRHASESSAPGGERTKATPGAVQPLGGDARQRNAVARITELLLQGAWSDTRFAVVMPANAKVAEGTARDDVVTIASSAKDAPFNYVSLGAGDDQLTLASDGDATADYWQGRASAVAERVSRGFGGEVGVMVPQGNGIFAGAGNDTVSVAAGRDANGIAGNEGNDKLTVSAGRSADGVWGGAGNDVIAVTAGSSVRNVTGNDGNDMISVASGGRVTEIRAGDGDDALAVAARGDADEIDGGNGADVIAVAAGGRASYISGGAGNDAITVAAAEADHIDGGDGDDAIVISSSTANAISGGRGDDKITFSGTERASVTFNRGDGRDVIAISGETTVSFGGRSLDDAVITYGEESVTIAFGSGDAVTLDYSKAALKGSAPEIAFAGAMGGMRDYAEHGALGFSLTIR